MSFWTMKMDFDYKEGGFGWMALEHRKTRQRIVLTEERFGSPWAMAFGTDDLEETLAVLTGYGVNVVSQKNETGGFKHALCIDPSGIPLLIYVRE
jgi:predicted enzyme related to lactoylglutathione lyase